MMLDDDDSDGRDTIGFSTARGRDWPSVRQFNIFLANRMGALLKLVKEFETTDVQVVSLNVVETADCAIIRLLPSHYERAYEILQNGKFAFNESDLIVVKLPEDPRPLLTITKALLSGEINLHYAYPLLIGVGPMGSTALAIHVDNIEEATVTLQNQGFTLFTEDDLEAC